MADANSSIQESNERLAAEIHSMGLMIKGLYEVEGTCIEDSDIEALHQGYMRIKENHKIHSDLVNQDLVVSHE
jgi:hypothetical protein